MSNKRKDEIPVLLGFLVGDKGQYIKAWCHHCAKFHNHGMPWSEEKKERYMLHCRSAHCAKPNGPKNYYIKVFKRLPFARTLFKRLKAS